MRLLLLLAFVACGSESKPMLANDASCSKNSECTSGVCYNRTCQSKQIGAACDRDKSYHCDGRLECFEGRCRERGKLGEKCIFVANCEPPLECYKQTCLDDPGKKRKDEHNAADERKRFTEKLEQAGVEVPRIAERPVPHEKPVKTPASTELAIRTETSTGKKHASAACDKTERLTGGGCKGDQVLSSYPSDHTPTDTIGARWNCSASDEVTAYALCARLP